MKSSQIMIVGAIVLFLLIGAYMLMGKKQPNIPPATNEAAAITMKNQTTQEAQEISMTAKQWEFSPTEIKVKMGKLVKLTIKSLDVEHGIGIPDFNVSAQLIPGVDTVVQFTPDKKGTFTFFCNVKCGEGHKDMKGTLIVE